MLNEDIAADLAAKARRGSPGLEDHPEYRPRRRTLIRADYSDCVTHCFRSDHELAREIHHARQAAHDKHGENSIESVAPDSGRFLAILVEEVGEAAHCLTYDGPTEELRAELIDVAAVVTAWIDAIDATKRGES